MSSVRYDLHTHTTYSDGSDIREMVEAATDAGLEGIGLTDHCIPYEDSFGRSDRYPFDGTYEDRRTEITDLRADDDVELEILDGAEVNYDPTREEEIRELLANAEFDYVIGSVHYTDVYDVAGPRELARASASTKRETVETYLDWQCRLLESGMFDVLGHLDLPQRSPALRGVMTGDDYQRLADALAASETVPEINAGRLERE